jgi:hypothetical protein
MLRDNVRIGDRRELVVADGLVYSSHRFDCSDASFGIGMVYWGLWIFRGC